MSRSLNWPPAYVADGQLVGPDDPRHPGHNRPFELRPDTLSDFLDHIKLIIRLEARPIVPGHPRYWTEDVNKLHQRARQLWAPAAEGRQPPYPPDHVATAKAYQQYLDELLLWARERAEGLPTVAPAPTGAPDAGVPLPAMPPQSTVAAPEAAQQQPPTSQPDGPGPRLQFFWQGRGVQLTDKQYQVCEQLWDAKAGRPREEVQENAVLRAIWGERQEWPSGGLRDSAKHLNKRFEAQSFNLRVERQAGRIWLEETPA
jgi:hypothetical protein